MKNVFFVAAFIFGCYSYACPNLEGSYTCKYNDGSSEILSISQENENEVAHYTLDFANGGLIMNLIADGVERTDETKHEDGTKAIYIDLTVCDGQQVINNYSEKYIDSNDNALFTLNGTSTLSLTEEGAILYTDKSIDSDNVAYEQSASCTK